MTGGLSVAILAAGSARRFGGGKLDADLAGKPLGRWALEAALGLGGARVAVVAADPAPGFAHDTEIVLNRFAEMGIGTSVSAAARWAMQAKADALLLLLADMPLVSLATLRRLAEGPLPAAVSYPGGAGVPACVPASLLPDLAVMTGDGGAAALLRARKDVRLVEVPAEELRDVDRPEDLADVERLLSSS